MIEKQKEFFLTQESTSREKAACIVIIAILFIIALAILIKQSQYDLSLYGVVKYEKVSSETTASKKIDTVSITPPGFGLFSQLNEYNADTLYEKINGKAPLYLTSGFKRLITQRYADKQNKKLWIEIFFYDMGSLKNAFSVYSRQKRYDGVNVPGDLYNYKTDNAQIMVRDNYYIEIIGSESDPIIRKAIGIASKKIHSQLGDIKPIPELDLFKNRLLVLNSEKYYIANTFGIKDFKNVFTAKYNYKNEKTTVFISGPFNDEISTKTIKTYKDFWINEGAAEKKHNSNLSGLILIDIDGYYETIFKTGNYCAGIHEAESMQIAIELSEILFNNLKSNMGVKQ